MPYHFRQHISDHIHLIDDCVGLLGHRPVLCLFKSLCYLKMQFVEVVFAGDFVRELIVNLLCTFASTIDPDARVAIGLDGSVSTQVW